jgi:hypothetical protein
MASHLERLGLSELAVNDRIRFLVDRAEVHSKEAREFEDRHDWGRATKFGAAGTCLGEAVSLSLLLGHNADDLLYQAAQNYLAAEHPYGLFLLSLGTRPEEAASQALNSPMQEWFERLDRLISDEKDSGVETRSRRPIAPQLLSLNQQLYLCFAMISIPAVAQEYQSVLRRMMNIMQSHSNMPHGPQGLPIQTQIDILEPILNMILGEQRPRDISRAMGAITRLSFHYGESIEAARRNSYLWKNMWSPVDYLDLEIVAAAMCMGRASHNVEFGELANRDIHAGIPLLIAEERLRPPLRPRPRPTTRRG